MAFFFFCFFVLKNYFKREQRTTLDTAPQSKQRLVLLIIDFANYFPELLKVVLDNVVQIGINRQFVDAHNIGKPVKCLVVFLPYIHRFTPTCSTVRNFKELSAVVLFGQLLWLGGAFFRAVR